MNHDRLFLDLIRRGDILWYRRFRDDGLLCVPVEKCNATWFASLCRDFSSRGSNLMLDLIQPEDNSIVWLDLHIRWGLPSGKVIVSCWVKPSNLGLYVPADSGHSSSVLRTWPRAEFMRIIRNSMRLCDVWGPVRRLRRCLQDRLYPDEIVFSLTDADIVAAWHRRSVVNVASQAVYHNGILPFVLPYHPAWSRMSIESRLSKLCADLEQVIGSKPRPILCFRNPCRHLYIVVRHYARGG